jgi:transposase-like protein
MAVIEGIATMNTDITNPIFHNEAKAEAHIMASRWPDGPYCPHCGSVNVHRMGGKTQAGYFICRDCRDKFTVRTGTVFERSHIPLHKWLLATHLMAASKKGVSAAQLGRMLCITHKSAWFMAHRIREAMKPANPSPIGGTNKIVEADETFVGGKARNRALCKEPPRKTAVLTMIERDGEARSFRVANVTAKTLRPIIVRVASRKSHLMTDELGSYIGIGKEFAGHSAVNHGKLEFAKLGGFAHGNTAECYFSILKRGIYGVFHSISEAHTLRYLAEFDMRFNTRQKTDAERAASILKGAEGRRLHYRQPREAAHA